MHCNDLLTSRTGHVYFVNMLRSCLSALIEADFLKSSGYYLVIIVMLLFVLNCFQFTDFGIIAVQLIKSVNLPFRVGRYFDRC